MTRVLKTTLIGTAFLFAFAGPVVAEHHESKGVERAAEGAAETVTSPGKIVKDVVDGGKKSGPVGVVTGAVTGTAKAAASAVGGAAKVGVGTVEAVTSPITGD